jgi:rSAM/selenodomain-associated transferase 1
MTPNAPAADAPRIAVFAKAPVAGEVKTRLAAALGAERAARVHAGLVEHALATAALARPALLELWCAPDAAHPFFARCAQRFGCSLRVQEGGDLGARMAHAFAASAPLVLIGSDCAALTPAHLLRAWHALRTHDAVFAPAEDGGYVLVALSRPRPALFRSNAWSEASVMRETRERLAAAGLRGLELETLWDVDRPEDFRRLLQSGLLAELAA